MVFVWVGGCARSCTSMGWLLLRRLLPNTSLHTAHIRPFLLFETVVLFLNFIRNMLDDLYCPWAKCNSDTAPGRDVPRPHGKTDLDDTVITDQNIPRPVVHLGIENVNRNIERVTALRVRHSILFKLELIDPRIQINGKRRIGILSATLNLGLHAYDSAERG